PAPSWGSLHGKREREAGAAGSRALEGDAARVPLDDRLHQPQAQAESRRLGLRAAPALEARKECGIVAVRRPRTLVPHPGDGLTRLRLGADAHHAVLG